MLSTKDVIQYLNQHGNVQAIEDMAAFFSVTPRTIRNHLRSVQDAYPACLQVGRGQVKLLKQIPEESSPSAQVPSSQQERSRYILRALLSRSEPMDLDELAASLFISEVTLQNEVKLIRHEIAEYHLSLRTKNNTLFISGSEKDKKRLMIHLIYNEAQHTLVSMETLHAIFPRYDIQKIRSDILACLNSQHLPFKLCKADFRLNPQCRKFLSIGLPLALQEFLTQLSFLALCAFVNRLGLEASSGYGVACKIVNFAMLIPSALMQSMAAFVSQNIGAGSKKRARQSMFTGIGIGLAFGCAVFALVWFKGDALAGVFTADQAVITNAFAYLKGFAPETIATAVLFSMVGYFNDNNKTVWVMVQGLVQTLLVRLPMAYFMSIQPNASLTMIGLAAPTSTAVGIVLNICFYFYFERTSRSDS